MPETISERDVRWVYRQFLGRDPEAAAVDHWLNQAQSFSDLAAGVVRSQEFREVALQRAISRANWMLILRAVLQRAPLRLGLVAVGAFGYVLAFGGGVHW